MTVTLTTLPCFGKNGYTALRITLVDFTRLTAEQKQSFDADGFLVVRNALQPQTVNRLLEAGDRFGDPFLKKAAVLNKPWHNDLDLRPGLLEDEAFLALVSQSSTVPLVVQLLSPNIHLLSTALIYKRPENPDRSRAR